MTEDDIVNMLHYKQSCEIQKKGISLALQEDNLFFLLQYSVMPEYSYNCATIFTMLEYEKCAKYFDDLFSWIEDLNEPNAFMIIEYLSDAPMELVYDSLVRAMSACVKRKNIINAQTINTVISTNEKTLTLLEQNESTLFSDFKSLLENTI